jgi:hypothetical protein
MGRVAISSGDCGTMELVPKSVLKGSGGGPMERRTLLKLSLAAAGATVLKTMGQQVAGSPKTAVGTTSAPASAPVSPGTLRRPAQAEIIQELLRERERAGVILPQDPQAPGSAGPIGAATDESGLIPEGTILVERPGRLVSDGGRPTFVFLTSATGGHMQTMELLPNQLLEAMERAPAANSEFTISGQVTRYHGRNYLLLLKVLHRVGHGNISP